MSANNHTHDNQEIYLSKSANLKFSLLAQNKLLFLKKMTLR